MPLWSFSTPSVTAQNIRQLATLGIPVVAGTTGWFSGVGLRARGSAIERWSTGVESELLGRCLPLPADYRAGPAKRFSRRKAKYQAWGWEIHHAAKRDAPSGTLLAVAEEMKQAGFDRDISLSASRGGRSPGERTRSDSIPVPTRSPFATRQEVVKDLLAVLCARARWILGKKRGCSNFERS